MDLHWLEKRLPESSATLGQRVKGMVDLCQGAISKVQSIAADLRPRMLDELGLAPALKQLGTDFSRRTGISCTVMRGRQAWRSHSGRAGSPCCSPRTRTSRGAYRPRRAEKALSENW